MNGKVGIQIDLVSGKEEANLGYLGIIQEYELVDGYILDIGGGSTEITLVEDGKIAFSNSLKLVSLSLMESYCEGIFPTKSEAKKMQDKIKRNLKKYDIQRLRKLLKNQKLLKILILKKKIKNQIKKQAQITRIKNQVQITRVKTQL